MHVLLIYKPWILTLDTPRQASSIRATSLKASFWVLYSSSFHATKPDPDDMWHHCLFKSTCPGPHHPCFYVQAAPEITNFRDFLKRVNTISTIIMEVEYYPNERKLILEGLYSTSMIMGGRVNISLLDNKAPLLYGLCTWVLLVFFSVFRVSQGTGVS